MKVLAINGSPRGENGNTDRILQAFLQGAREAGAEIETIYLRNLKINPCLGCFTCWTKTPGVCVHNDDMVQILPKIRRADIVVYATPLYVFTVSGLMKNFMDRLIPNVDPHIVKRGKHFIHPPRYSNGPRVQKIVLISNCGFPEPHHFSALIETFKRFTDNPDME
ncbi:MAG: flavodoxin family protein, partial [Thermoproteota archaeon]